MTQKKKQPISTSKPFGNVEIKRKGRNDRAMKKELFVSIITNLDLILVRQENLFSEFRLDWTSYNEPFFNVVDDLLFLEFGEHGCELIEFYLYDKFNQDGSVNDLIDKDGNVVPLDSPEDLWNLIQQHNATS